MFAIMKKYKALALTIVMSAIVATFGAKMADAATDSLIVAGGCFWCVDSIWQKAQHPPTAVAPVDRAHTHRDTCNKHPIAYDTQSALKLACPTYSNLGDNPRPDRTQFYPTQGLQFFAPILSRPV